MRKSIICVNLKLDTPFHGLVTQDAAMPLMDHALTVSINSNPVERSKMIPVVRSSVEKVKMADRYVAQPYFSRSSDGF
jgi:hypothetical protein